MSRALSEEEIMAAARRKLPPADSCPDAFITVSVPALAVREEDPNATTRYARMTFKRVMRMNGAQRSWDWALVEDDDEE